MVPELETVVGVPFREFGEASLLPSFTCENQLNMTLVWEHEVGNVQHFIKIQLNCYFIIYRPSLWIAVLVIRKRKFVVRGGIFWCLSSTPTATSSQPSGLNYGRQPQPQRVNETIEECLIIRIRNLSLLLELVSQYLANRHSMVLSVLF